MIGEFIAEMFGYVFINLFGKFFRIIGATVFSLFSLFKTSPLKHYHTDNVDRKASHFVTGLVFTGLLIRGIVWMI